VQYSVFDYFGYGIDSVEVLSWIRNYRHRFEEVVYKGSHKRCYCLMHCLHRLQKAYKHSLIQCVPL
jgi:hypothetical protein